MGHWWRSWLLGDPRLAVLRLCRRAAVVAIGHHNLCCRRRALVVAVGGRRRRILLCLCGNLGDDPGLALPAIASLTSPLRRSEERRVGKECRSRWWAQH